MTPRSYPATHALWRALKITALVVAGIVVLLVGLELARFALLLRRFGPLAVYGYLGLLFAALIFALARLRIWRPRDTTLRAPTAPTSKATFSELKRYNRFLIALLKGTAEHPRLSPEQARAVRQRAYDLESMLGAHPLIDDLRRGIARTESEIWPAILESLDRDASEFARYKMTAVVRDAIEPPFPVVQSLLLVYHQVTMICGIVDCYVANAALRDYAVVLRDVWNVMAAGDYFRVGQRLFEGIYRNSPPLGPAVADLGQALSVIWITRTIAQATMHRCRTLGGWSVAQAVDHLDHSMVDSLLVTRDALIHEALPLLKLRLRHNLGPAVADAAGFSDQIVEGIKKAVDSIVQGLRAQAPEQTAEHSRRAIQGEGPPVRLPSYLYAGPDMRPRRELKEE